MADCLRDTALCRSIRAGTAPPGYALTEGELARLRAIARQRGMAVACMLYRASRLVGITRRAPALVEALGPDLRHVFEAYLAACPDADPDFDREARQFERFAAALRPVPGAGSPAR
jgi:hypothetical protein